MSVVRRCLLCCLVLSPAACAAPPGLEQLSEVAEGQRYPRCLPWQELERLGGRCHDLHEITSEPERQHVERVDMTLHEDGRAVTASGLTDVAGWFRDVEVLPSGEVVAVGGRGLKLARSDDEARSWTVTSYSGFADLVLGLAMRPDGRGYAVSQNGGTIFDTHDGGRSWEPFNRVFAGLDDPDYHALHVSAGLFDVAFADATTAVAVGYERMLRTTDDGMDWAPVELPVPMDDVNLQEVAFTGPREGWTVGSGGTVLRTRDGGAQWEAVDIGAGDTHLMGLDFVDAEHGCIGGGFKVWCTTDGGATWHTAELEPPRPMAWEPAIGVSRLRLRDAEEGWLITEDGLVYASADGGRSWTLWLDLARPGREDSDGVSLMGLALGRDRAWVVGSGTLNPGPDADPRWDTRRSPLLLSWPLDP
ncbi:YCF48-related protein [Coralloluteibacterium stylophorae]|uniref:Photosynthesis system II assembly factor Ycf48/Hcf136-like domain-containing protein n=1 Tax=Coralloluteibacterium stylophorae TaxID=1776034 RepID=A0A8J7VUE2_9GAMM|nr:YCF48-related protein [Coralloluteibacterium stylophorae]MBS7455728.1 hypothetical protein [Coralloluteibacterium stylophorae]